MQRIAELERELAALRAERDELSLEQDRLRSLMDQCPFGVVIYNPDGSVRAGNAAMMRQYSLTEAEYQQILSTYNILEDPQLAERGQAEYVRRAFAGQASPLPCICYEVETPIEGTPIRKWVEGVIYPIRDRDGAIHEVVSIQTDVSRLVAAQEELRRAKDAVAQRLSELEQLYATTPVGLALMDTELRFIRINQRLAAINGRPVADHLGRGLREILPEMADQLEPIYRRVLETGEPALDFEVHGVTPAEPGVERDWLVSYHPLRGDDGTVLGVSTVVQEITERKRAEQALRESEERFRAIAETIREVFWLFDRRAGRMEYVSPGWETVWGRSVESILASSDTWVESIHPDDRTRVLESFERIASTGERGEAEYRIVRPDGQVRWISVRGFAIRNEAGEVARIVGISEDVTERKRAEEEHRQLEAKVQHAQKLESLGVLAGGIAHDFNNLLMAVLGNADLTLGRLAPESPCRDYVESIRVSAQRATELTSQLLAYSGRSRLAVEPIDLNHLVEEMAHLLQTVISKKAELRLAVAEGLPTIEADAGQVRQVVMNLITNASEAIGDTSGTIAVTTGAFDADAAYLAGSYFGSQLAPGRYVRLEISDSGVGMDEATRDRIFEPFFTTKFTGRGLGLAAVLGIVRGHRAAIRVESEPGRGSTFSVLFPPATAAPKRTSPSAASAPMVGDGRTVLVVDDEAAVRKVCRAMLEEAGFRVLTAADGREGVKLFAQHADQIDLVLLDMTMPELDGREAFHRMQEVRRDVPVLLASGFSEHDANERFAGTALAGFIAKPYTWATLMAKIREVLETRLGRQPEEDG